MVTFKDAKDVADVIVDKLQPFSVLLFGSVAREGKGSDLDLLVLVDDTSRISGKLDLSIHKTLKQFYSKFAIDPFIIPLSTFCEYYTNGSPFLSLIVKEGRYLYMREAAKEWIKQAEYELNMAEYLLQGGFYKGTCYHSQQCVEKTLKARLLEKGWALEKTHSMERLVSIGGDYNLDFNVTDDEIVFVDSIYRGRYPIETGLLPSGEPSKEDGEKAVRIAMRLLASASQG